MTTKASPSKRQPSTSSAPIIKPQCKIHSLATVADKAQLTGGHFIEIGENAFIHPHARLKAEHGNIAIGEGSIVAEKAVVGVVDAADEGDMRAHGRDERIRISSFYTGVLFQWQFMKALGDESQ